MLANGAVGGRWGGDEQTEAWCWKRVEEAERERVEALRGRACVFCLESKAAGLILGVKARPRA